MADNKERLFDHLDREELSMFLGFTLSLHKNHPDSQEHKERARQVIEEYKRRYLYFYGWPTGYQQPGEDKCKST